jgi:hypothetical protein
VFAALVQNHQQRYTGQQNDEGHEEVAIGQNTLREFKEAHPGPLQLFQRGSFWQKSQ